MTPDELPGALDRLAARAADAAAPVADAMANAEHRYLVTNVLIRHTHPALAPIPTPWGPVKNATQTTSAPGEPPALVTGTLRRSLRVVPAAVGGLIARAELAPHTVYARIQEVGGGISPVRKKYLRWATDSVIHFSKHVVLPARPYMRPGRDDLVADGAFRRAAIRAFARELRG